MKIIAHRGASALAPENTLKAIKRALVSQAAAIEIDVYRNQDELLVIHDRWLQRTTDGQGCVQQVPIEDLQSLDAGDGEQIPTLWQVLQCINGLCDINIELKGSDTPELVIEHIHRSYQELNFQPQQFLLSSFNHHLLQQIKIDHPEIKTGALTSSLPIHYAQFTQDLHAYSIHIDVNFLSKAFIDDAHQRGLKVFVYTVDEQEEIEHLAQFGVDGIFSNHPSKSKKIAQGVKHIWAQARQDKNL